MVHSRDGSLYHHKRNFLLIFLWQQFPPVVYPEFIEGFPLFCSAALHRKSSTQVGLREIPWNLRELNLVCFL